VQQVRDEVHARRSLLEDKLEAAITEREKQLKHLTKLASSAHAAEFNAEDVHELQQEKKHLMAHVDKLLQERENSASANDSKVTFIRDRLAGVEKRREKLEEEVAEMQEEQREAEAELRKVTSEFKALVGANDQATLGPNGQPRPQTDAQMKEYMNELNRKTQRYKSLKAELEHERSEIGVLVRTEEILRSRAQNLTEFNAEQERRLGVVGYGQTQEQLEAIAAQTAAVNEGKGATLEELSEIIEQIKASMLRKKDKLTPQITELRGVRADFEAIEAVYRSKKAQYDNVSLGFESERLKLEQDVQSNAAAVADDQSHYHFLHAFATVTTAKQIQVAKEAQYKELYEKAIAAQEAGTKSLRLEKKTVSEKHDEHVKQRALFGALKVILQKKLDITRNPQLGQVTGGGSGGAQSAAAAAQQKQPQRGSGSASYLDELAAETDRLVFD
jgi:intraflagellar transport protein 81